MRAARPIVARLRENLAAIPHLALAACLVCGGVSLAAGPAAAAGPNVPPQAGKASVPDVNARRAALFKRMMAKPADLGLAFEYAALSSQAGDLEGAISTLERMLIFAPDLARLKLELGALYFRLGSYETARGYFDGALQSPDVAPDVRDKARIYLAAIEEKTQISSFHGSVALGMRYQTNANNGVSGDFAFPGGFSYLSLDRSAFAESDTNAFIAGQFHYRYVLPTQGDTFDVNLLTYGSLYSDLHENDTLLAELTFGPDFSLGRFGIPNADFSVYGILGGVVFDGDTYRRSIGVGAKLGKIFDALNRGELRFEYRHLDYRDSDFRPTASDRTGSRFDMSGYFQHAFNDRFVAFAVAQAARHEAAVDSRSFWEGGGALGLSYAFDSPISALPARWTATLSAGVLRRIFDEPDSFPAAPSAKERDTEAFVSGMLTVPLADTWAIQTSVGYRDVSSNYDLYSFAGANVSIAIAKRF